MENRRFLRTQALLGEQGMENLRRSRVMVVGLGAVGGYALEALARSGIGALVLVDFDIVEETNVNRQILALTSTIGRKKTEVARARVLDINPDCHVETKDVFVNADTLESLFLEPVDYVVDAIDALNPKCCLIEFLYRRGIPFVSSMGAALKSDPGCIRLTTLNKTKNCSLARFIRKRLKRREVDISKVCCVASEEQCCLPETAIFMDSESKNEIISCDAPGRKRHTLGSLPAITAIFGLMAANEVIKKLSKKLV